MTNLETKKTYVITAKEITHTQYEELRTFYVGDDGVEYTYDDGSRKKHTEPTGKYPFRQDSTVIYEQTIDELDLGKVVAVVNKL